MGRKLYVGNFPYETGEAELQDLFARAGTVETVKVMRDMATGRARGFAFVEMSSDDEAQKAIAELNEYQLGGRSLSVNEARPKPASAGGFGGGESLRAALVSKHEGRGETGRQPCPSTASRCLACYSATGARRWVRSTKQVMPSVELNNTDGQKPEIGDG